MINYEVIITEQADYDLRGIYEYIAFELLAPGNAAGQLDRLEDGIMGLATFPERFRVFEKEPWKGRGLRVMPIDNYLVFYIPDKKEKVVAVIRVMYAGRDVDNRFGEVVTGTICKPQEGAD